MDTFLPAVLLLDEFGIAPEEAQVLFLESSRNDPLNRPSDTSLEFSLFSSSVKLSPSYLKHWRQAAASLPVCVKALVAGMGCKFLFGCWESPDMHRARDYQYDAKLQPGPGECTLVHRQDSGRILNAGELEALVLALYGQVPRRVSWETLSPLEQVAVSRRTRLMIGLSSSSTHNFVFMPDGAALIDIVHPTHFFANVHLCKAAPRIRCLTVPAILSNSTKLAPPALKRRPDVVVPLPSFEEALRAAIDYIQNW